jgi:hypothetical protein
MYTLPLGTNYTLRPDKYPLRYPCDPPEIYVGFLL